MTSKPLYKKGDKCLPDNYRPISLLSVFDKIIEKLMHSRLYNYLLKYNILYEYQFGFRKNHSTSLALVDVIENIYNLLDKKEIVIGLYFDLKKTFDTVNHDILLHKLSNYGIRGTTLDWFKSYLNNRKQFVSLSGFNSDIRHI